MPGTKPPSMTRWEDKYFESSSLVSVSIPSWVKSLGDRCFQGCPNLKTVICKMENVESGCFFDRTPIETATLYVPAHLLDAYKTTAPWSRFGTILPVTAQYEVNNFFSFTVDRETQEATFDYYRGNAAKVVVPEKVTFEKKEYEVTSLRDRCFSGCDSLTLITIPSSVTSCGWGCFSCCSSLVSIEIPFSVTSLGDWCFDGCRSLVSVEIPFSVTSLGNLCFYGCSSLVSVEIPSSVTSMGNWCFYGCSSLVSVEIPSSVSSLKWACFWGCRSLASIEIPSSVTSLGEECFYGCSSLETVICRMEKVESGDFFGETPIEKATLYVPVHLLDDYKNTAPWNRFGTIQPITGQCETDDGFTFAIDPETQEAALYEYSGDAENVVVPEKVTYEGKEYRVTRLIESCFAYCSLVSVVIPASVTSIGDNCFSSCDSLEAIVVDVDNPHYDSREECNAIIETASNTMIAGCKNTVIPSSVRSLGICCFWGCSSLVSIVIPFSVNSLENACFVNCSSLVSVSIPSSVERLETNCFSFCPSLKTVMCRMENVEGGRFFDETPIEEATLYVPEHLLDNYKNTAPWSRFGAILPLTFWYETDNGFFTIDLETQEASSEGCDEDVTDFVVPEQVTYEGKEYKVTRLDRLCFEGCSSLVSIVIPSSVTSLGGGCFYRCSSLVSVSIPSSVTWIGDWCFYDCSSLKTVICRMENVKSGDFFDRTLIEKSTLYVPEHLLDVYRETEPWSCFGTILPLTEEMEEPITN